MTHHAIARRDPRDPTEESIHRAAIQFLRFSAAPGIIYWHCPNGEARSKATGAKLQAMGVLPGVADICLVLANGRAAFIEIKNRAGRQMPEQKHFERLVVASGALYAICRSHEDIERTLTAWGALRGSRPAIAAE